MEGREGDLRVPIISCLFFLFVITGGVLLCLYVFNADVSQPWFPIVAFALIGSPWIFWFLTYIYTCIKACCRLSRRNKDRQMSRHRSMPPSAAATTTTTGGGGATMDCASPKESPRPVNSPDGQRHVHFGAVVVMDDEESRGRNTNNQHDGVGESSIASSTDSEMPLTLSVKS